MARVLPGGKQPVACQPCGTHRRGRLREERQRSNVPALRLGEKEIAKLKAMHGAEFDKAYIDNEVAYHESVIGALDKVLLPNARNAELKSLLEAGRPIFVSHLNHAKEIQASLR